MKYTLRVKLITLTTLLVTLIMATVTYFFTIRELETRRAAAEAQIERIARNIATMKLLDRQDWSVYQNYITRLLAVNDDIVYIAVYDDRQALRAQALNMELIERNSEGPLTRRGEANIVRRLDRGAVAEESRDDLRTQTVNIQVGDRIFGSVHVGFSLIEINSVMADGIRRNVIIASVFLAFSILLSFVLGRRLTGPLERLSSAMSAIARGDFSQKVSVDTKDEIGQLSETFNVMVQGLHERYIIESLGHELGATFQLERLAPLVRERLRSAVGATSARLCLRQQGTTGLFREIIPESGNGEAAGAIALDEGAQSLVLRGIEGFDLGAAPSQVVHMFQQADVLESDLVIPMAVKGRLFGLLMLGSPEEGKFDSKQRQFAYTLANQAALALENAMLYDELREQERLKRELEIAREVQRNLLPAEMPQIPGFQIDGVCLSAQEVGGDYYDVFHLGEARYGIAIADVSGKGTSASFYMAELKGMMLSLSPIFLSPREVLNELNRHLYSNVDRRVFATMIYGIMNAATGRFVFARAGHNPLLYLGADGGCRFMTPAGIGLGLEQGTVFERTLEEVEVPMNEGDTLILFTDGVTEAMNPKREEFGEDRLLQVAGIDGVGTVGQLRERILGAVHEFAAGSHPHDDLSMVIVQYEGK